MVLTDAGLLLGSANLTIPGFGYRDELDCLILDATTVSVAQRWYNDLWDAAKKIAHSDVVAAAPRGRAAAASRPPVEAIAGQQARMRRDPSSSLRSLGWMTSLAPSPRGTGELDDKAELERNALVVQLRKLTRSREEARLVMDLFAEALLASGLARDDSRLHLNFGRTPIAIAIGNRYVVWFTRESGATNFCFIMDDRSLAKREYRRLRPRNARVGCFRRNGKEDAPTLHVALEDAAALPADVRESWFRAIATETSRTTAGGKPRVSPHLKLKRPFLFDVLANPKFLTAIVKETHAT